MPNVTHDPLVHAELLRQRPGPTLIELRDGGARGLVFTVLPSGRKLWSIRYVFRGRHRRLGLGEFPAVSLAKARNAAGDVRTAIRAGHDPYGERQAAKARPTDTLAALADAYVKGHARPRKKTGAEDERILTVDVIPHLGDRSVRALTRREIRSVLERIAARGAPYAANRTLEIVRKMLNWGIRHDWLETNPATLIEKPGIETARERVLTDDELRALWALLSRFPASREKQAPGRRRATADRAGQPFCPLSPALAAVTKFRLLSAQRGGEVVRMRWADVDLDAGWWTVPATDSKNGKPHRVPLTSEMIALIKTQPKKPKAKKPKPKKPNAEQSQAEYVFTGKASATVEARVKKAGAMLSRVLGFEFRSHDLRRTASSRMAECGVPRDHISHTLNHTIPGAVATRVYDRYNYDAEKRVAVETWNRELQRILAAEPKPTASIVPISTNRRRA